MSGRLRLDTLTNLIGSFLREHYAAAEVVESDSASTPESRKSASSPSTPTGPTGPLYYHEDQRERVHTRNLREEMETAVPLTDVLASSHSDLLQMPTLPQFRRSNSAPKHSSWEIPMPDAHIPMRARRDSNSSQSLQPDLAPPAANTANTGSTRQKRQLVNRRGSCNLDEFEGDRPALDYVTVPTLDALSVENIVVPLIPFDEIMLIGESAFGKFILPIGRHTSYSRQHPIVHSFFIRNTWCRPGQHYLSRRMAASSRS
jgi:hypothetical protein